MDCDELDVTELISNIYRETRDEDHTDFEVVDEMIGHSRVVSSLPKPKPVRWGACQGGEVTETGAHVSEVCGSVYRSMPVPGFSKATRIRWLQVVARLACRSPLLWLIV